MDLLTKNFKTLAPYGLNIEADDWAKEIYSFVFNYKGIE